MRELESNRPGMKGDSSEMLQVPGSNEQNHRVALLSAAAHLTCLFFPLNVNVLFQCPPFKKMDVAGNGKGINMNNKLFVHV